MIQLHHASLERKYLLQIKVLLFWGILDYLAYPHLNPIIFFLKFVCNPTERDAINENPNANSSTNNFSFHSDSFYILAKPAKSTEVIQRVIKKSSAIDFPRQACKMFLSVCFTRNVYKWCRQNKKMIERSCHIAYSLHRTTSLPRFLVDLEISKIYKRKYETKWKSF